MAITTDQLKLYKSIYVNDSLTNGGRISAVPVVDNSMNNLFRNIQSAERLVGIDQYRKVFLRNENPDDLVYENPALWISNVSSGEDYFQIAAGTDTDNKSAADDYTDWHGSGLLAQSVGPTESSFLVNCKKASGLPSGSSIIISDGSQQAEVVMLGAPSWNGYQATVTISGEIGLPFLKDVTTISPLLELADIGPSVSDWVEDIPLGAYDETTYPVMLFNIGAIVESWTLTFTSSTAFTVSGAVTGSLGAGSTMNNFVPAAPMGYYFFLDKDGWSGSPALGDTLTFKTVHAAKSFWIKESVPAGAASQANNLMSIKLRGESA